MAKFSKRTTMEIIALVITAGFLGGLSALLIGDFLLGFGAPPPGGGGIPPVTTLEECPHDWVDVSSPYGTAVQDFTGGRHDIPEHNDCQRFFAPGSAADPKYTDHPFAIFIGDGLANGQLPTPQSAAAAIWAGGAYRPLGITKTGFYCLTVSPQTGLNATIAPADPSTFCNGSPTNPKKLWVHTRPLGSKYGAGDQPPVVRWGFDGLPADSDEPGGARGAQWVHYAILPCGDRACYVGPSLNKGKGPGFVVRSPIAILAKISQSLPGVGSRVHEVEGWHDTQFLADPTSTSPQPTTPTLVASIIPDSILGKRSTAEFQNGWVRVAEVAINGSAYEKKLNFSKTDGVNFNTIDACVYTSKDTGTGKCLHRGVALDNSLAKKCIPHDKDAFRWRSRHINATGSDTVFHCIELRSFGQNRDLDIPGTARWKWDRDDEKTWFRCPEGCCLVEP